MDIKLTLDKEYNAKLTLDKEYNTKLILDKEYNTKLILDKEKYIMKLTGELMKSKNIFLLLLLFSLSFANVQWLYPTSNNKVCFNLTSDGYIYGSVLNNYYTVPYVNIYNNNSFADSAMLLSYGSSAYDLYKLTNNNSNAVIAVIPVNDIAAGSKDYYCIYGGGNDKRSTSNMQNGYYVSIGATGTGFVNFMSMINMTNRYTRNGFSGSGSGGGGCLTPWSYTIECNETYCNGLSVNNSNNYIIYSTEHRVDVACGIATNAISSIAYRTLYSNMSVQSNYSSIYPPFGSYGGSGTTYIYVDNQTISLGSKYSAPSLNTVAWNIISHDSVLYQNFSAVDVSFDFRDYNISILTPQWGTSYSDLDGITFSATFGAVFDNCSYYLNDNMFASSLAPTHYSSILSNVTNGENQIRVSCNDTLNIEHHNYVNFFSIVGNPESLFADSFNISVSSLCNSSVVTNLYVCNENYKKTTENPFSAVICPYLNLSANYSCIINAGINNFTKNNYTIFFNPNNSWSYATSTNTQHVGAMFYYNGQKLENGIELLGNKFVYIPAQNKTWNGMPNRDCGVYYLNTNNCSYSDGFMLNDGTVYVSDRHNNWFASAGLGFSNFDYNLSQIVVNTQVIPVNQETTFSNFGMFQRVNCLIQNGTYNIYIKNTVRQLYALTIIGNGTANVQLFANSSLFTYSIPVSSVSALVVSSNNQTLCSFGADSNMFLPSIFTLPFTDGFFNILPKIFFLMTMIYATIIPYALIGAFILNDLYHVVNITYMGTLVIFVIVGGLVNNINPFERGLKHMVVLLAITLAYISALTPFQDEVFNGCDVNNPDQPCLSSFTTMFEEFRLLMFSNNPTIIASGLAIFITDFFIKIIFLPMTIVSLIYSLLLVISPATYSAFGGFQSFLSAGAMLYFYIKAYEVLSNRFRNI